MAPVRRKKVARTTPRIEETEPKSSVRKSAKHRGSTQGKSAGVRKVETLDGTGYEITCQASELVPVAQYASVTVGPLAVTRTVIMDEFDPELLKEAINEVQDVVEEVVAEDRQNILEAIRAENDDDKPSRKKG